MACPRELRDAAAGVGVGPLARVLGTVAMTLSSMLGANSRGRGWSTTPATAGENALAVEPNSDEHEQRLNNLAHRGLRHLAGRAARSARRRGAVPPGAHRDRGA